MTVPHNLQALIFAIKGQPWLEIALARLSEQRNPRCPSPYYSSATPTGVSTMKTLQRWLALVFLLYLSTHTLALSGKYFLSDEIVGPAFYTYFDWEAIDDPTHGRV
jgi:hypothetical protein